MSGLDELLVGFLNRTKGTLIRGQTVESVELSIDTNGENDSLRYILHVFFREPELPVNMTDEMKLLRRVFWQYDYALVKLSADEIRPALAGEIEIPEHQWVLPDEITAG